MKGAFYSYAPAMPAAAPRRNTSAAEYLKNRSLAVEVQSRGTNVRDHVKPDIQLVTAIFRQPNRTSRRLSIKKAIDWADLILTMKPPA